MTPPDPPRAAWNVRGLALASLGLALASGLLLALWYEPRAGLDSLGRLELGSPSGRAVRALHAASTLCLVLFGSLHAGRSRRGALALPLVAAAALTGVLLRGDAWTLALGRHWPAAQSAAQSLVLLLVLHVVMALPLAVLGWQAFRRARPSWRSLALVLGAASVLGWLAPPGLEDPVEPQGRLVRRALALDAPFASQRVRSRLLPLSLGAVSPDVPRILGRREGCLGCHAEVRGLGPSHDPRAVGCSPCHLGNPFRPDAAGAHDGLLLVPGNLDGVDRTCGRCHAEIGVRVRGSLMARANGIVAVNRFVFGERPTPDGDTPITAIGHSPADTHLRQLCASCHLGKPKDKPAATNELSRGGGCTACHLGDDPPRTPAAADPRAFVHPGVSLRVSDASCFGCHSRSARISLTYAGWRETFDASTAPPEKRRQLLDGRAAVRETPDVHHEKGLACIDCHTAGETMGDGQDHAHEEQATRVRCTTCHRTAPPRSLPLGALDARAATAVRLRGNPLPEYLLEDRSGEALTNARPLADGSVELIGKLSGTRHLAKPPATACSGMGHERLACQSCHASWAHRCVSCHTQNDQGTWVEYDAEPQVAPPTLGVVSRDGAERIEPFTPGMVLTLNSAPGPSPLPKTAPELYGPSTRFVRAYAFAVPHTITRGGRSCRSCHLDSIALGYGEGTLRAEANGWRFEPKWPASPFDGLPLDAWIGFLSDASGKTTRLGQRSLGRAEQERVLDVGACFGCHDPEQQPALYRDWKQSRARLAATCKIPREASPHP